MPRRLARLLLAVAVAMTLPFPGRAADPASEPNASNDAQGIQFFETKVRPLLVKHCYECHGEDAQESDLRLDTHDGIMRGGRSGMAVVAGKPTQSLLLTAVGYQDANLRMPPETKLAAAEVADLRRWIEIGAPHPDADTSRPAVKPREVDFERGRAFWAFQPPVRPAIPQVKQADWPTSPIDYFVLSKLEENGLRPAPPADRLTLIRRATFDLLG
ncbi:MAG: DUF1549 domain-containing protein, partial [Planctomycetales bacterium]|nr:DUF1549 domain-containing protein [Planctomycetales bacterium]